MRYVEGDITQAPEIYIVHGCNMLGKMNSGVAKALRNRFPQIYDDYMRELPESSLGDAIVSVTKTRVIGNLLTQEKFGYDGEAYASANAIVRSLKRFIEKIRLGPVFDTMTIEIASPKIGCGRGGLEWDEVVRYYGIIEWLYNVEFVIYDIPDKYSK